MSEKKLYEHQKKIAMQAADKLKNYGIVYLGMQMRTGKTLTALEAARIRKAKNVLFVTKKKVITSIQDDYQAFAYPYALVITNYESLHKVELQPDLIIVDESHGIGAIPKPTIKTKLLKHIVKNNDLILLSGTPTPESFSQWYHQFWISERTPFGEWSNFYKWAKAGFVDIKQRMMRGGLHNDYSHGNKTKIMAYIDKYLITYTQEQAGFKNATIKEEVQYVTMDDKIYKAADILLKKRYMKLLNGDEIVCDTAVKLQQKLHQLYSGTIITENDNTRLIDTTKADYIINNFTTPYAVYYKYKAEGDLLKKTLKDWTESPEDFNAGKSDIFLSQVRSGSMGINISRANTLIAYNIDFSAVLYWQMMARIQAINKVEQNKVVWLFAKGGIEDKIYKAVKNKKSYTSVYFKEDYLHGN